MVAPLLLIRADAGTDIGTGHVMRCLALAQAWQEHGGTVYFAAVEFSVGLATRLVAERVPLYRLDATAGGWDDARETVALAQRLKADWVVVDGYQFGTDYQRVIKEATLRLLVVDDFGHAEHYVADLVLNQNVYADAAFYPSREASTELLLGLQYVLLRREYWPWRGWQRDNRDVAHKVLVTMGGSDLNNRTLEVIRVIQQCPDLGLSVVVVAGGSNPHVEALKDAVVDSPNIRLVQNATNMPELIAWSDVAISAGGSTCWELAFMGTPMIALVTADNQQTVVDGLHERKMARVIDDVHADFGYSLSHHLSELVRSSEDRRLLSDNSRTLVDGYGAFRIVRRLMRTLAVNNTDIQIRPALPEDAEDLWTLANDPSVRLNSFNSEPIALSQHLDWYHGKLQSDASAMWIAECNGTFAGQIRYDRTAELTAEIGISVHARFRGFGVGSKLLLATRKTACRSLCVSEIRAVVFASNLASQRIFHRAGFLQIDMCQMNDKDCYVYAWQCMTV